jgi:hypothetical protein
MISFCFEDSFDGLGGAVFRGLTETTGRIETFLLAGTEVKAGAGTRGTETEAGVTLAVETSGTVGVVGTAGTEAETGTGVALGIEAFSSYARLNKNSR